MLKVFHKYILKNYLTSFIQVTLIFLSLVFVLNIFEEINFFKDEEVSFLFPLILTFLNSPSILYDIFPFIFLISVQVFFIKIIDRDELTAFQKFGFRPFKLLPINFVSVLFLSLVISLIGIIFQRNLNFHT
jgi:Predicted permeases